MNSAANVYTRAWDERADATARETRQPVRLPKDEAALLARLRAGDGAAFDAVVEAHHGSMIRLALNYVADRDVAEEVVQDSWIALLDGLDRFEDRSSLRTWLFGIVIHKAKDRGVREKRHTTFSSLESSGDESEDPIDPARFHQAGEWAGHWAFPPQRWDGQTPEKLLASKQAVATLYQAIDELPPTLREVLVLRDVEGVESKETCDLLSITENNLYVRLHRARERVRRAVESRLAGGTRAV